MLAPWCKNVLQVHVAAPLNTSLTLVSKQVLSISDTSVLSTLTKTGKLLASEWGTRHQRILLGWSAGAQITR